MSEETQIGDLLLRNVVLDWPNLYRPGGREGDTPRYGASFILDPANPEHAAQIEAIKAAQIAVCKAKWKDQAKAMYDRFVKTEKLALREGDDKITKYPYLAGKLVLATASKQDGPKPTTVDGARKDVPESAGLFYRGCIVNAKVQIWAQDNKFGQRINCQLRGVQFVSRGEALGAGGAAQPDEFEAIAAPTEAEGGQDEWA